MGHTKKTAAGFNEAYKYINMRDDNKILKTIYDGVLDFYKKEQIYIIARIQKKRSLTITIINGELNDMTSSARHGAGFHAFDLQGASAFISSNTFPEINFETAAASLKKLITASSAFDIKKNREIFNLEAQLNIIEDSYKHPYEKYELNDIVERVKAVNKKTCEIDRTRLSVTTNCSIVTDEFIIMRSDSTFSSFSIPRTALSSSITAKDSGHTATLGARLGSSDLSVIYDDTLHNDFIHQSDFYAREAVKLCSAPAIEAGRCRIVIDYALAKGLAHEAFGHAAEADLHKGSILWQNSKFIKGERVASEHINIIDGPLFNDYAWQPVGANGNRRHTTAIVKNGIVEKSLCDIFSAAESGVPNENSERIEGFDCPSIPRMSNIRLEHLNAIKTDKRFYELNPQNINNILADNGLLAEDCDTLLLSGYKGGQVNPAAGDFVFNCSFIYKLNEQCKPVLYKPAIFAGKTLSALNSIIAAIGPVKSDALGTCGKSGQGVPSSGGSNYYLIIDKNDNITIG